MFINAHYNEGACVKEQAGVEMWGWPNWMG